MSNLLPCPFCGWEAHPKIIGGTLHTVACKKCNASSDVLRTQADAITAWNTRQTPATAAPSNTQQSAAAVLTAQEAKGLSKYGTTLDTAGLSLLEIATHYQQEAADALMYATAMVAKLGEEAAQ